MTKLIPLPDRYWPKVDRRGPDECWPWTAGTDWKGYGKIRLSGRGGPALMAHRVGWELARGPIPEGLFIDHLCRNHGCQNPAHMELVTNRENVLRGVGPTAVNSRKAVCLRGHPYDDRSKTPAGGRQCRVCQREFESRRPPRSHQKRVYPSILAS